MTIPGHIQNGVIVLDQPVALPEGAVVRIEVLPTTTDPRPARKGGKYKGQVWMAPDFDEWPEDLQREWGMAE